MKNYPDTESLVNELLSNKTLQQRIDILTADITTGRNQFSQIPSWDIFKILTGRDYVKYYKEDLGYKQMHKFYMCFDSIYEYLAEYYDFEGNSGLYSVLSSVLKKMGKLISKRKLDPEYCSKDDFASYFSNDEKENFEELFNEIHENLVDRFFESSPMHWHYRIPFKASNSTEIYFRLNIGDAGDLEEFTGPFLLEREERAIEYW